jgi:hypothetical protein
MSGCQDSSYIVRKSFICKLYGLLKNQAIPIRYACAFALASTDCAGDVRTEVCIFFSGFFVYMLYKLACEANSCLLTCTFCSRLGT